MSFFGDFQSFNNFLKNKDVVSDPIYPMKEEKIRSCLSDFKLWRERNHEIEISSDDMLFRHWLVADDFRLEGVQERIPDEDTLSRQIRKKAALSKNEEELGGETNSKDNEDLQDEELYLSRLNFLKQWINASNKIILPQHIRDEIKSKYLDNDQLAFIRALPWWTDTAKESKTYLEAEKYLNATHFGLDNVKKDILNYVTLKTTYGDKNDGLILLLNGPAGVGKTSIARSIADVLGKPFHVIKLGGMSTAADIDGHAKNWKTPGAGAIARAIKETGSFSPVILLDELDKIGKSQDHGTPHDALLYILDTDNTQVVENYLEIPIDLSKIIFIATSNDKSKIDPILLDRMEIIEIRAYNQQEKKEIANKYILKKLMEKYDVDGFLKINDNVIDEILNHYAIEPGVRTLQRYLNKICQYGVIQRSRGAHQCKVDKTQLKEIIGDPVVGQSHILADNIVGTVYALDFNGHQGFVRCIQVSAVHGKGEKICTGNISKEVKESVEVVISHIKRYAYKYKISMKYFATIDFHFNFTGTMPYNGYDFGFPIALALLSAIFGVPVPNNIASIGEITLDGSITNVSNKPERIASAISREGLDTLFLPKIEENEKDYTALAGIEHMEICEFSKLQELIQVFKR